MLSHCYKRTENIYFVHRNEKETVIWAKCPYWAFWEPSNSLTDNWTTLTEFNRQHWQQINIEFNNLVSLFFSSGNSPPLHFLNRWVSFSEQLFGVIDDLIRMLPAACCATLKVFPYATTLTVTLAHLPAPPAHSSSWHFNSQGKSCILILLGERWRRGYWGSFFPETPQRCFPEFILSVPVPCLTFHKEVLKLDSFNNFCSFKTLWQQAIWLKQVNHCWYFRLVSEVWHL